MIVDDATAQRLARAVVSDATLYGGEAALVDQKTLAEMRELYRSRVSPSLHHLLETEIAARVGGRPLEPSQLPPSQVQVVDGAGGGPAVLIAVALALLAIAGGVAFFLVR